MKSFIATMSLVQKLNFNNFQWDLVCDKKWVAAMVTTVQMAGVLVGCFVSGHLGDFIGRKPTFYVSQLLLVLFNVIAYFSVNVHMYAVVRFVLGMGKLNRSIIWFCRITKFCHLYIVAIMFIYYLDLNTRSKKNKSLLLKIKNKTAL